MSSELQSPGDFSLFSRERDNIGLQFITGLDVGGSRLL